jgi:hypothetical protein
MSRTRTAAPPRAKNLTEQKKRRAGRRTTCGTASAGLPAGDEECGEKPIVSERGDRAGRRRGLAGG